MGDSQKVVAYQYRYLEQNEHCANCNQFGPWQDLTEARAKEIREYIRQGYSYELRELGVIRLHQGGNCRPQTKD